MDDRRHAILRELARHGHSRVVLRGHCMEPFLRSGDEVEVHSKRLYLPGDVIVFRTRTGELAAHRVLGWRPAGVITKGDHCDLHDAPVARAEIIGAVEVPVSLGERLRAIRGLLRVLVQRLTR